MKIECTPEEIAAIVLAIQERPIKTTNITNNSTLERKEYADWLEEELARRLKNRSSTL